MLDRRAGFARQREDIVAAIFGRQVELFERLDDRRVRAYSHVLGFKPHDGAARGGQRHSYLARGVIADVLINGRLAIVLRERLRRRLRAIDVIQLRVIMVCGW